MKITRLWIVALPCLVLALAGCGKEGEETDAADDGGTAGDGDGDNDEQTGNGCGNETETVLDDLFATPAGFSMPLNEVLAGLEGNFEGTFSWYPTDGGWGSTYAGTESPLTAAMAYSGGAIRLVEVEKAGMPPDGEAVGVCANYVVIDVILEFATEDGAFAEAWTVPLTISASEDAGDPSIYASLDLGAMMGMLGEDDILLDQGTLTDVVLTANVNASGLTGEFNIEVEVGAGPEGIVGFGSIGHFDGPRVL